MSERGSDLKSSCSLDAHRAAELLREDAAHQLHKRLSGLLENESAGRIRPGQLETGSQRGNPNLAHRRIRADHKFCFLGFFEQHFEFSASAFDLESVNVAKIQQPAAKRLESGVALLLEFFFIHGNRVPRSARTGKETSRM